MKVVDKGAAKSLAPPCQGAPPLRPTAVGRAYVMSKKKAATSGTVVTETLFFKFKGICVLFDSGATRSLISTRSAMELNLEDRRTETNYKVKLPNACVIECSISYKLAQFTIAGTTFLADLIQFDSSDFDIILGMNWLQTYGAKIDSEDLKVILKDGKGREVSFYGQREEKSYPLISAMKASKLLRQGCMGY